MIEPRRGATAITQEPFTFLTTSTAQPILQTVLQPESLFGLTPSIAVNASDSASGPNNKTILLVDDNDDVLVVIKMSLEMLGYCVVECSNGQDALDQFVSVQPEVAIVDHGLPDMTGIEVGKRIKAMDNSPVCRLILLTGSDGPWLRDEALQVGFDEFMVKPIRMNRLADCIEGR